MNIVTQETFKVVKESCKFLSFLKIELNSSQFSSSIIRHICELTSLKTLKFSKSKIDTNLLIKILGDYLVHVEYLELDFYIEISLFKYFTEHCKANLKKWVIFIDNSLRKDYLKCLNDFQKAHNHSLKALGIFGKRYEYIKEFYWTNEELEIIESLGIEIVSSFSVVEY